MHRESHRAERERGSKDKKVMRYGVERPANWHGGNVVVQELLVMSSELTPQGPNYTILSRAKLR